MNYEVRTKESKLVKRTELLDHGYLEFIESWGSDERIVEAARMSTAKGFLGWGPSICEVCYGNCEYSVHSGGPDGDEYVKCDSCKGNGYKSGDEKLLRYLWEHKHVTPFEMAGMVIEVQAPIFVFREWHRHRTQSYNEMSARYVPLPDLNYVPTVERLMLNSNTNKQAGTVQSAVPLSHRTAELFRAALHQQYEAQEKLYQLALLDGVPKELARIHLPVGRYSRMRASANLRNWLAFLTLRMDANAQYEIRQYANAVGKLIAEKFPRTWELFHGD